MGKKIIVLSDGTGNSSSSPFKSNVWRTYDALDLTTPPQIAFYDDGVGTSSQLIARTLGQAFGFGLKRNVLELYKFLCRTYRPGDEIYAFGFSRGAFTIRVLIGLVSVMGLANYNGSETELAWRARTAYRRYKRNFSAWNDTFKGHWIWPLGGVPVVAWIVGVFVDIWHAIFGGHDPKKFRAIGKIAFVGVWDTVDAYGMPIEELRDGIDKVIWPLSMRDRNLSVKVATARHALALDDERATFHPLLWNDDVKSKDDRILQVWFSGAHADVGGGYPDDRLPFISLNWMIHEAQAAGLSFLPGRIADIETRASYLGPIHEPRSGFGVYYRYLPRRAKFAHNVNQIPPLVHSSVMDRVANDAEGYAPISLGLNVTVVDFDRRQQKTQPVKGRSSTTGLDWNKIENLRDMIWWRRVTYFTAVWLTVLLVTIGLWHGERSWWFENPLDTLLGPVVTLMADGARTTLPDFASPVFNQFKAYPGMSGLLTLLIFVTWFMSARLGKNIQQQSVAAWTATAGPVALQAPASGLARVLRTNALTRSIYYFINEKFIPLAFGVTLLIAIVSVAFGTAAKLWFTADVVRGELCAPIVARREITGAELPINAHDPCFDTGYDLDEGRTYRIRGRVDAGALPRDGQSGYGLSEDLKGFSTPVEPAFILGWPARRWLRYDWFQPVAKIMSNRVGQDVVLDDLANPQGMTFTAKVSGRLYVYLNDASARVFYANNSGSYVITVEKAE